MVEICIPLGPHHPGFKEPENFKLYLEGEEVVRAEINIGYIHRGIEKLVESRTYIKAIYVVERICGICSHTHTTNFVSAAEEILELEIPKRGQYIRTLVGELERIHSHLLYLGVASHVIGFDTLFMYIWQDRETVQDILEVISGNRVNYAMNTIGGVRRDMTDAQINTALRGLEHLEDRAQRYIEVFAEDKAVIKRTAGVGVLKKGTARRLNAVGPTLRGSGVKSDIRKDDPYGAYPDLDFNLITADSEDVYGRNLVRLYELFESIHMCRQILENIPAGPINVRAPYKIHIGEAVVRTEAPRGEDMHYLQADGSGKPARFKVRAPTYANILSVPDMLKGAQLADVPIISSSIDPCFGCMDRALVIDKDKGTRTSMDFKGVLGPTSNMACSIGGGR